jgi:hypothetical protein
MRSPPRLDEAVEQHPRRHRHVAPPSPASPARPGSLSPQAPASSARRGSPLPPAPGDLLGSPLSPVPAALPESPPCLAAPHDRFAARPARFVSLPLATPEPNPHDPQKARRFARDPKCGVCPRERHSPDPGNAILPILGTPISRLALSPPRKDAHREIGVPRGPRHDRPEFPKKALPVPAPPANIARLLSPEGRAPP